MLKTVFAGAGSTTFAKKIIGDILFHEALKDGHIALYDIDPQRLDESKSLVDTLNRNINADRAKITAHCGVENRPEAFRDADYIVNAIQVGGYKPSTVIDFEIPKKYGLRQTIADTLGIGGIFRALRTIPVMLDFARDMEKYCPDAWLLNYTNPMAILTGAVIKGSDANVVGLCHSVQKCAGELLKGVGMDIDPADVKTKIAGINHMAWLLEIKKGKTNLYPEIKQKASEVVEQSRKAKEGKSGDMIRLEMMRHFGYYITESSEHFAEYLPYWIKSAHPELIEEFNIPLDKYPRLCEQQIEKWQTQKREYVNNPKLSHEMTLEYGAKIINGMHTDSPFKFSGNVLNENLITNLPNEAVVEVPCIADANGITPCHFGALPMQCAALNMTNINPQLLTIEAALTRKKDYVYQAAMLDPHTAAELTIDQIRNLCDDMFEAHGDMIPDVLF